MIDRLQQLAALGQSIWLDYISRDLLDSGRLQELVDQGLMGITSNPSIFNKAICGTKLYDDELTRLARAGSTTEQIYAALVLRDIREAADVLRGVYNETHGRDGFVSVEVNPHLAHNTEGTIEEARRLFGTLERPNIMIKVPATEAGLPAISTLIGEGINVNVTLIFAVSMYERVAQAYLEGLRRYAGSGKPLGLVSSVASFFVSRVDTLVDKVLQHRIEHGAEGHLEPLFGQAAVANAKIAYQHFKAIFFGDAFAEFRSRGARPQRPLWASTSTKNPAYPDTKYVDPLVGMYTVNTLPPETLVAVRDHGVMAATIESELAHAQAVMRELAGVRVDMEWVTAALLEEGVKLFADAYDKLLADIEAKRVKLASA